MRVKDYSTIMAVDENDEEITAADVRDWIKDRVAHRNELAQFVFSRLHGRYIRPFKYEDSTYKKSYKNGFSMMANSCLLIETFASFRERVFKDTNHKSEKCFGWFFLTQDGFLEFSEGGLTKDQYLSDNKIKNKGIPREFYRNVRCGILHNGETRNGWKIQRRGQLFDRETKTINAYTFMQGIEDSLNNYRKELLDAQVDSEIWDVLIDRIDFLITRT